MDHKTTTFSNRNRKMCIVLRVNVFYRRLAKLPISRQYPHTNPLTVTCWS